MASETCRPAEVPCKIFDAFRRFSPKELSEKDTFVSYFTAFLSPLSYAFFQSIPVRPFALHEIDEVLQENAEVFVEHYVQKGSQ